MLYGRHKTSATPSTGTPGPATYHAGARKPFGVVATPASAQQSAATAGVFRVFGAGNIPPRGQRNYFGQATFF